MLVDTPRDVNDPFEHCYAAWPLEGHHQVVYAVSQQLRKDDPPLFTLLITPEERYEAFHKYKGQCLNCLGNDALKFWEQDFLNKTGLLNPEIGPHGS